MAWFKVLINALLPYIIDGGKYLYRQLTLKRMREERARKKAEAARKYEEAQTEQEIKEDYENLP